MTSRDLTETYSNADARAFRSSQSSRAKSGISARRLSSAGMGLIFQSLWHKLWSAFFAGSNAVYRLAALVIICFRGLSAHRYRKLPAGEILDRVLKLLCQAAHRLIRGESEFAISKAARPRVQESLAPSGQSRQLGLMLRSNLLGHHQCT